MTYRSVSAILALILIAPSANAATETQMPVVRDHRAAPVVRDHRAGNSGGGVSVETTPGSARRPARRKDFD